MVSSALFLRRQKEKMSMDLFSFKELYECFLKITYPLEVAGRQYEVGEVIAKFDKIQIAGLQELSRLATANGGFDNRAHVFWQETKEIALNFSQGVFSKLHFALLSNSRLLNIATGNIILVSKEEEKESSELGVISLSEIPKQNLFVYNKDTGEKLTYSVTGDKELTITTGFTTVIVDYEYEYDNGGQVVKIGQSLIPGYLTLEGKTRVKDDNTGQTVTGIIKIPKLKLMSDLSMRLGSQAQPVGANFSAVGVPVGSRGNTYVSEFYFLNNDIDSDL